MPLGQMENSREGRKQKSKDIVLSLFVLQAIVDLLLQESPNVSFHCTEHKEEMR